MIWEAAVLVIVSVLGVVDSLARAGRAGAGRAAGGWEYTLGLSLCLLILTGVWLTREMRLRRAPEVRPCRMTKETLRASLTRTPTIVFAVMALYAWLCPIVGYLPSTAILFVALLRHTGHTWGRAIVYACIVAGSFQWVFTNLAKVSLP